MSLILSKNKVTLEQLRNVPTPAATETHFPIPHITLVEMLIAALINLGFVIREMEFGLSENGSNMFGGMAVESPEMVSGTRQLVVGVRNSHSKKFPAALCIGNRMLVCDNLCFSSEEQLARRHTKNILADLPSVIAKAVSKLITKWQDMESRIEAYRLYTLTDREAADLVVQLADVDACPPRDMFKVIQLWRKPELAAADLVPESDFKTLLPTDGEIVESFDVEGFKNARTAKEAELIAEFGGRTLWGLYNALTFVLKGSDLSKLPFRTMKCQGLFDCFVGRGQTFAEAHIAATVEMANADEPSEDSAAEGEIQDIEGAQV